MAPEQRPLWRERVKLLPCQTAIPRTCARPPWRRRRPRRRRRCSARLVPSCAALTRLRLPRWGLMIPQRTGSPPRPKRLSSASRIISSGWSGSTTAAPEKALVLEIVNNADPSRAPQEASRNLLNVRGVIGPGTSPSVVELPITHQATVLVSLTRLELRRMTAQHGETSVPARERALGVIHTLATGSPHSFPTCDPQAFHDMVLAFRARRLTTLHRHLARRHCSPSRQRGSQSATSAPSRGASRSRAAGRLFSSPRLVSEAEPAVPAYSRAEQSRRYGGIQASLAAASPEPRSVVGYATERSS